MDKQQWPTINKSISSYQIKGFIILIVTLLFSSRLFAQPIWTSGPAFTANPISVDVTFSLDQNSTVYYFAYPFSYALNYTSNQVRNFGINGGPSICDHGSFTYSTPGTPATIKISNFPANTAVTIYMVAATNPGNVLQATPIKTITTTLPCPPVYLLTGFPLPTVCVNKGTRAFFTIELPDADPFTPGKQIDPDYDGVYAGTTWSLNWGDGTVNTYTSVSDSDIPTSIDFISHVYNNTSNCIYEVVLTTVNPCGKIGYVSYSIEVHGRDQHDNDGELIIEDVATGVTDVIRVCEGVQHTIQLRDISDWNCQDPRYPDGTPGTPNDEPRTIQWVYGEDHGGAIRNTIGTTLGTLAPVIIGGSNTATTANGYEQLPVIGPITSTGQLSREIVIPADCRANEYFDVYLRNWNKCNPYPTDQPVFTHIRILVVEAPPAPTISVPPICEGESTLLDPSSTPQGEFHWYDDGMNFITTGDTYDPGVTAPGVYTYYVTDQQLSGDLCESPPTEITLTINPIPDQPTISRNNPDFCFDGTSSITLTANPHSPPAVSRYQWYRNGTAIGGATGSTITLNAVNESGTYRVRSFGVADTYCESPLSDPVTIVIGLPATVDAGPATATICSNSTYTTGGSFGGGASSATWSTSGDGSFGNTGIMTTTYTPGANDISNGSVTLRLTTNNPDGPCTAVYDEIVLSIVRAPSANAGADASICFGSTYTVNDASASDYNTITWTRSVGTGTLTNANTLTPTYTPSASDAGLTVTLRLTATGNSPCGNVSDNKLLYIDRPPVATTNPAQEICGTATATATLQGNMGTHDLDYGATGIWSFPSIWKEDFNDLPDGTTSDAGATAWTRSYSNNGTGWYSEVRSRRYVMRNCRTIWTSDNINISSYPSAGFSADISSYATNNFETSDNITVRYIVDGVTTVAYTRTGAVDGSTGSSSNAFRTVTVSASGITGNNLVIQIEARNNSTGEYYYFDNITVTSGNTPVITDPTNPASTVTNLPSGATTFTWTVSSAHGGCTPATATHTITRWDPPTASDAGDDDEVCENVTTYTLTANTPLIGTGQWSTTGSAVITNPDSPVTGVTNLAYGNNDFTWTISNGNCTPSTDVVTIFRNSPVSPGTISADQHICEGETPNPLTGTAASGGDGTNYAYSWQYSEVSNGGPWITIPSTNNTGYSPGALTNPTWYRRLASSGSAGCTTQQNVASNVVEIMVEPSLLPGSISGNQSICLGDQPAPFASLTPASGGNNPSYLWYHKLDNGPWSPLPGETNAVYTAPNDLEVGTHHYYREAISSTGVCGPVQSNEVHIIVNPGETDEIFNISGANTRCENASVTLTYSAVTNATEYVWDFSWVAGEVNATTAGPEITIDLSSYTFDTPYQDVTVKAAGINGCNVDPDPLSGDYPWSAPHNLRVYRNPVAEAGPDDSVCGSLNITLSATPSVGTGTWSDPGTGPGTVTFDNANLAGAVATATHYGTYILQWSENNGGCTDYDNVTVTFYEQPVVAAPDDFAVCGALTATLAATGHTYQSGSTFSRSFLWEYVSGPDNTPSFGSATASTSTVTVDHYGTYRFRISETNGSCSHSDIVEVIFSEDPVNASAGADINVTCDLLSTNLNGTAHNYLGGSNIDSGTRTWSYVSGPDDTPSFSDPSEPDTQVSVDQYGNYVFRWTERNGSCTVYDDVTVKFFEDPDGIVGSGPYEADCGSKGTDISVTAHTYSGPAATHPESTRGWSRISGPDETPVFSAPADPSTNVAVDNYGTYVFRWTETNGPCSNHVDVIVTFYEDPSGASAGGDITALCNSKSVNLAGTAHVYEASPSTHTGSTRGWIYISGPDATPSFTSPTSPTSEVVVDYYGTYEFEWFEINGNCERRDRVIVRFCEDPVDASAGDNITAVCDSRIATLGGTAHTYDDLPNLHPGSTRTWSYVSGPDNSPSFTDASDPLTDVEVDYYGTYVFRWTEVNGNCTRTDDVTVTFHENPANASAGPDITASCGSLVATLEGTAHGYASLPSVHPTSTRTWSYVSGPDNTPAFADIHDPETNITVDQYGVYVFRWTETNGNCTVTSTTTVTFYEAPLVSVTPVAAVCRDSSLAVIPVSGSFGGGASSASWSIVSGSGELLDHLVTGNTVTASYRPSYDDIMAGSVTLRLTTNDPAGPCASVSSDLTITIDEAVYVVIDQAPSMLIAEGTGAVITATISGARGAVTTGVWTEQGMPAGGTFDPSPSSNNITFTPTAAQTASGSVVLRLTSADPGSPCGPVYAEITVIIGANPVADAGPDIETCEPSDSLIYLSGYAKSSANDADWSVTDGAGMIISQTKTWSSPQSAPHDENDSLLVEAVYRLHLSDYGPHSTSSQFRFLLTTDDPDDGGPVTPDSDEMIYTIRWAPKTPPIGGGGKTAACAPSAGNFYSVPLTAGNTYMWEIEVLSGAGVPGTDYRIAAGGTGYNFIAIDWISEGTYNLKVTETTYLSDGSPCPGATVIQPVGVYTPPVVTAGPGAVICIGETYNLSCSVTGGSGSYIYEWSPAVGLSAFNIPDPVVTGTYTGDIVYTVKVTDIISGCQASTATVTITTNPLPDIFTLSGNSYYCFGSADGTTLTLSGSETNVIYQLINGSTPEGTPRTGTGDTLQWKNIFDGSYYVQAVRNAVPPCERTMAGIVNVTANPEITMTVNQVTGPSCFGGNDGAIYISAAGGTPPFTYLWSGPGTFSSTGEDVTGLYAGIYRVEITDSRGCKYISPDIEVLQPAALAISSIQETVPVTCHGGSDGEAEVIVNALTGTAPFTYQWFYNAALSSPVPGAFSAILSGVPAGTYYVLVLDANLCTVTGSVTITQPPQITGTVELVTPVSCNGESDAVIRVTAAGGSGLFEFDLNGEDTWANTDGLFSGLGHGSYTLRVRDQLAPACIVSLPDVVITEPAILSISGSVTSNYNGAQISCVSAADGVIAVSGTGGTAPYRFNIDGGAFVAGTSFSGLAAGTYTMGITDDHGCTDYIDITITSPDPVTGTASAVSDYNGFNVRCHGGADGIIEVSASGGTGTLRYSINGGPFQLSDTFTGLTAGSYDITVRDANMCNFIIEDVPVTEPDALIASAAVTSDFSGFGISCYEASDGEVTASASGGAGGYLYQWYYNAALTWTVPGGNAAALPALPAGTYYVRVTDANGCTAGAEVTVSGPTEIVITRSADVTLTCSGDGDGSGSFSVTGGTGNYTIVPDVNGTGASTVTDPAGLTFTGASGGVVSITVTDENGCQATSSITINEPLPITASAQVTSNYNGWHITCYGASDGRITVTASGGTGSLSFELVGDPSNVTGASSGVFTGLAAGDHDFTVTDANGCQTTVGPVTITPPPELSITVNVISDYNGQDISCYGASDGRAEAVVSGGSGYYTYTWYRDAAYSVPLGQLTPVAYNLTAGVYYVRARDINGCIIDGNVTLGQPDALTASITAQDNADCFSNASGSVTVEADAGTGTAPYQYSIDGGGSWQDDGLFENLRAMPYTVLVRDVNGCLFPVPVTITQPTQLIASVTDLTHVSCNGGSDGAVTITPSAGSGTAPYRFSLNGGTEVASGVFTDLSAGPYVITVLDDNDCSVDIPVVITEPPVLELNPTPDVILACYGLQDGTGTFYAAGGTPGYTFTYDPAENTAGATFASPGYNTQTIFNAGAGSVTVTVTDSKGCVATATISFTQPDELTPGSILDDQVLCYGEDPAIMTEDEPPAGGPAPYDYRYQWQYSTSRTGIFVSIAGATQPDYDPQPAGGATTTLYYRRMVTSGSCAPVYSNVVEVLVNPRPVARLSGGAEICPGDTAYLFVEMLAGTGPFTVDINGLTDPVTDYNSGDTIIVMPSATTTYTLLSVTDANNCESAGAPNATGSATVTVRGLPAITSFTPPPPVCEFSFASFSVTADNATAYQWWVNTGTDVIRLEDGGTYSGTATPGLMIFNSVRSMNGYAYYVVVSGCGTDVVSPEAVFTVNTAPELTLHPSDTVICLGQNAIMRAGATDVAGLEWFWFVHRGSGFELVQDVDHFSGSSTNTLVITNPPYAAVPWVFRAMAKGTCGVPVYTGYASMRVVNPPAVTRQPVSVALCENGSASFLANASGYTSVNWQVLPEGGDWTNLTDDGTYLGSVTQQLSIMNALLPMDGNIYRLALVSMCDTVYSDPALLTVHPNPVVDFSGVDPVPACGGVPVTLHGNPSGGSGDYTQHRWTGDVGPLNNYFTESPVFNATITGDYNLNYRVTDSHGCTADGNLTVIVDSPSAQFTQDAGFGCTPLTVNFTKDVTGLAKWWWDFGDGSPVSDNWRPLHTFAAGHYTVTLTVSNSAGSDQASVAVIVERPPHRVSYLPIVIRSE